MVVAGRVQGVFFRARARDEATRLGLSGWIRNRSDGRVEAEFQGPADAVEQALAFCKVGPEYAEVTGVEVAERDPVAGERGFVVR